MAIINLQAEASNDTQAGKGNTVTNRGERQWYSVQDSATYMDITELNVQNLTRKGILPHHAREGRLGLWFRREDLENVSSRLIRDDGVADDPLV